MHDPMIALVLVLALLGLVILRHPSKSEQRDNFEKYLNKLRTDRERHNWYND